MATAAINDSSTAAASDDGSFDRAAMPLPR